MKRMTGLIAVTAAALLIAAPLPIAARTVPWPAPPCPPAADDQLVDYAVAGGLFGGFTRLVVYRNRYASLCWVRRSQCDPPSEQFTSCFHTGRTDFAVSRRTMEALTTGLDQLDAASLGPPPPRHCRDCAERLLSYEGTTIPYDGYPSTQAGVRALGQAEAILERISSAHRRPA
jgi:hypothetical protein